MTDDIRRPRTAESRGQTASAAGSTILDAAARLATIEGLEGLSIGRLADHIGMSKSGLYAHFGSKEELQLATIETASEIFDGGGDRAGRAGATTPLEQVEPLCEQFLSHVERRVFPGGCFFASAAAELDTHPGAVRERIAGVPARLDRPPGAARPRGAGGRRSSAPRIPTSSSSSSTATY